MTICVVLSTQRSGSTLLVDYLSSTPGILIHSELFQRLDPALEGRPDRPRHYDIAYQTFRKASVVRRLAHRFRRGSLIDRYLHGVIAPKPGIDVIGLKLMYDQARKYPEVLSWLDSREAYYVHLVRENLLDMIVSRELAVKRGTYSMRNSLQMIQVYLDVDKLMADLARISRDIGDFREFCLKRRSRELTYEALVADKAGTVRRILEFVGANPREPAGSILKKTNPAPLKDVISNYNEVASVLGKDPRFKRFVA